MLPQLSQPPNPRRTPISEMLRTLSAWLLCFSFFYMIPMEFAALEWERTSEGLWRIRNGGDPGMFFAWMYLLWMWATAVASLCFIAGGFITRFSFERRPSAETVRLTDLAYYVAWVQFLTLAFMLVYYSLNPDDPGKSGGWFDLMVPFVPHLLMLWTGLWLFRKRWTAIGFRRLSPLRGGVMAGTVIVLYLWVCFLLDPLITEPVARFFSLELQSWRENSISDGVERAAGLGWGSVAGQVLLLGFIGPVAEEILFRGILMQILWRKTGATVSVISSAVIFALFHVDITFLAPLLVLGLILGALYAVFRSLWAPVLFHVLNNTVSVVLELLR